jgi:hypothetical protein
MKQVGKFEGKKIYAPFKHVQSGWKEGDHDSIFVGEVVQELFSRGNSHFDNGRLDDALYCYKEAKKLSGWNLIRKNIWLVCKEKLYSKIKLNRKTK